MPTTEIGGATTLLNLQENSDSPRLTRNESGTTVRRYYNLKKSEVKSVTDGLAYGSADSDYGGSYLTTIEVNTKTATKVEVVLVFQPTNLWVDRVEVLGTVTQEIDANPIDIPIRKEERESGGVDPAQADQDELDGVQAILKPQPIYRRTEILNAFVFSEANAINDVGKVDNTPEDLGAPTAGKWLKVGNVVRTVGDKFEKTETWQYAENGWGIKPDGFYTAIS